MPPFDAKHVVQLSPAGQDPTAKGSLLLETTLLAMSVEKLRASWSAQGTLVGDRVSEALVGKEEKELVPQDRTAQCAAIEVLVIWGSMSL